MNFAYRYIYIYMVINETMWNCAATELQNVNTRPTLQTAMSCHMSVDINFQSDANQCRQTYVAFVTQTTLTTEICSKTTKNCCNDKEISYTFVLVCLRTRLLVRPGTARLIDLSKSACEMHAVEVVATSGTRH